MKIGLDARLFDSKKNTGISRYTQMLNEYYISRYGLDNVWVLVDKYQTELPNPHQIATHRKPFNIYDEWRVGIELKDYYFDIFHTPFYSSIKYKTSSTCHIVTVHDIMCLLVDNFFSKFFLIDKISKIYFACLIYITLHTSDLIIAVSKTTQKDLLMRYGVESEYITETSSLTLLCNDSILKANNLISNKYFLYYGNNRIHKNTNFIIKIFREKLPHLTLVLIGHDHQSENNIRSLGVVTDSELRSLINNAIAIIYPSIYEGFGLPILEALQSYKQVIASDIPSSREFNSILIRYFQLENEKQFIQCVESSIYEPIVGKADLSVYEKMNIYRQLDNTIKGKLINCLM